MNKKISIYISCDGLNDPLGQSQIIPYLEKIKIKNNLKIFTMEKIQKKKKYFKNKNIDCLNIKFIQNRSIIYKIFNYINFLIFILIKISRLNVNIIHCRGFIPAIFAVIISCFKKSKIIYDMRGFWIDEKIDDGTLKNNGIFGKLIYIFLKQIEKHIIKSSNVIVVLSYKAKKYIIKKFNRHDKIFVIPCSVDYKKFNYLNFTNKKKIKKDLGFNLNGKTIIYIGSYGFYYMVKEMLQIFLNLNKKIKNLNFLVVTNQKLKFKKAFKDISNIKVLNSNWKNIPKYLSICDISFCMIKPTFAKIASTPTKASESFSMGVPIITNKKIGDYETIINKEKIGCLINTNNINDSKNYFKINELLKLNKKLLDQNQENILILI